MSLLISLFLFPFLRIKSHNNRDDRNTHHKPRKYNIWTSSLQEESLLENLKGCGVDKSSTSFDRNIESYDYSLKYRLNGENALKRRQSNSDDSDKNFGSFQRRTKRFRSNNLQERNRKNVRLRLGNKSDDSSSNDGLMNQPRIILDLTISIDTTSENIARQIANNLYEEKDDLMCKCLLNLLWVLMPLDWGTCTNSLLLGRFFDFHYILPRLSDSVSVHSHSKILQQTRIPQNS